MFEPDPDAALRAQAGALSAILGIEQTPERAAELIPAVGAFMADIALLWKINVNGCEMAVRFDPSRAW
jgi:hypothetical protein